MPPLQILDEPVWRLIASQPSRNVGTTEPISHEFWNDVASTQWPCRAAQSAETIRRPETILVGRGAGLRVDRVLSFVRKVRAAVLHLRDARVGVVRMLPVRVAALLRARPIQPRQIRPRRRLDARGLRQPRQKGRASVLSTTESGARQASGSSFVAIHNPGVRARSWRRPVAMPECSTQDRSCRSPHRHLTTGC